MHIIFKTKLLIFLCEKTYKKIFDLVPLNQTQWIYTIGISFLPIIIIELQKMLNSFRTEKKSSYYNSEKIAIGKRV